MRLVLLLLALVALITIATSVDGHQSANHTTSRDTSPSAQLRLEIQSTVADIDQEITTLSARLAEIQGEESIELIRDIEALKEAREQRLQEWQMDRARRIAEAMEQREVEP